MIKVLKRPNEPQMPNELVNTACFHFDAAAVEADAADTPWRRCGIPVACSRPLPPPSPFTTTIISSSNAGALRRSCARAPCSSACVL